MALKAASRCEICHKDTIEEERGTAVGRKLNGVARIVCSRSRCQREWKRIGVAIKATWPENVVTGRSAGVVVRDGLTGARICRVVTEANGAPMVPEKKEAEVKPDLRVTEKRADQRLPEGMVLRMSAHRYPMECDAWAVEWVRAHGAQKGTFRAMARFLLKEHREWVTHRNGAILGEETIACHLVSVCRAAGIWRGPKAAEKVKEIEPVESIPAEREVAAPGLEAKYLRRLARAAHDLVDRFVGDGKTAALEAVVEMMEEEAGRA